MPFKKVTLQEWQALGLPTEISTVHLGNTALTENIKYEINTFTISCVYDSPKDKDKLDTALKEINIGLN